VKKKWELPAEVRRPKEELEAFLARVLEHLGVEDHAIARAHVETVRHLLDVLQDKNLSLKRLRGMLFETKGEKTSEVLGQPEATEEPQGQAPEEPRAAEPGKKCKGHGRNGISKYSAAEEIHVPHATLHSGDVCPCCKKGKVYDTARPGVEPRIKGRPPLEATVYCPQRLRCNLCGEVFTAALPRAAGTKKYDETAVSVIILLKYGTGMPFHRLESLEESLGAPLPAATQWELVEPAARACAPAHGELERQAAQGEILHNDDTKMKILGRKRRGEGEVQEKKKRKGVVTTGIISKVQGHTIALYVTGPRNAGENLGRLLEKRAKDLPRPIQMADGLEANIPKDFETILANCAAHGRRKFVELHSLFPEECRVVLEIFREVYHNDELSRGMSPEERLCFHKERSGPAMAKLKAWLKAQFQEKKVEPNSRLGKAISYLLDRWERLGRFLEVPGAPLDNNIVERALKLAILHRKNALYYRTARGAEVGDLFMSLIQTARLSGENPFEYLTALQRNAAAVRERPGDWMPWNYRSTLEKIEASRAGGKGPTTAPMASEKLCEAPDDRAFPGRPRPYPIEATASALRT
jgi:transposase